MLSFRKSQAEEQKKLTAKIKPNSNGQSANLGQNLGIAERKAKIARERKATELHSHTKTNSHPNITSMIAEQVGLSGNNSEYNTDNDSIADDQEEESPYMYRVEISMMEIYNDQVRTHSTVALRIGLIASTLLTFRFTTYSVKKRPNQQ